jgi:hypothetical protein
MVSSQITFHYSLGVLNLTPIYSSFLPLFVPPEINFISEDTQGLGDNYQFNSYSAQHKYEDLRKIKKSESRFAKTQTNSFVFTHYENTLKIAKFDAVALNKNLIFAALVFLYLQVKFNF